MPPRSVGWIAHHFAICERPDVRGKRSPLLFHMQESLGIADYGTYFPLRADHTITSDNPLHICIIISSYSLRAEGGEGKAYRIPLSEHCQPAQATLHDLHAQSLKMHLILINRATPLLIMIFLQNRIRFRPAASSHIRKRRGKSPSSYLLAFCKAYDRLYNRVYTEIT